LSLPLAMSSPSLHDALPIFRNAFRPGTVDELYRALDHARMTSDVGTILLTGNGPSLKDGGHSFCSGGDQRIRGRDGYRYAQGERSEEHTSELQSRFDLVCRL